MLWAHVARQWFPHKRNQLLSPLKRWWSILQTWAKWPQMEGHLLSLSKWAIITSACAVSPERSILFLGRGSIICIFVSSSFRTIPSLMSLWFFQKLWKYPGCNNSDESVIVMLRNNAMATSSKLSSSFSFLFQVLHRWQYYVLSSHPP